MPRRRVPLGDGHEACQPRLRGEKVIAAGIERALGRLIADREQQPVGVEQKVELHRQRCRPCGCPPATSSRAASEAAQLLAQIAPMTFYAGTTASAQNCRSAPVLVAFFKNGLMDSVGHDRGLFGKFRDPLFDTDSRGARLKASLRAAAISSSSRRHETAWDLRRPRNRRASSRTRSTASATPWKRCCSVMAEVRHSRHALASAIRCPARFPLSTEDTYCGSSGRRSRVSYQL